uniref:Death domain-containing protein n=3 Tax=Cacopsylla melanoneura TaxID=428564 RepID=A0A8D8LMQ9_9HEMI
MNQEVAELLKNVPHITNEVNEFQAAQVIDKMKNMHATLLFEPEGWQSLKDICLGISGIPVNSLTKGWRDFAAELDLNFYEIGCIANYNHEDYSELAIKTFSQDKNATIDKILQAIVNIERWDVIRQSSKSLHHLYETVLSKEYESINKVKLTDQCETYLEFQNAQKEIHKQLSQGSVIKAKKLPILFATLPITLKNVKKQRDLYSVPYSEENNLKPEGEIVLVPPLKRPIEAFTALLDKARDNTDNIIFTEVYQKAVAIEEEESFKKKDRKYEKIVMLTYASDGVEFVKDISAKFRTPREGKLPIGVLTLGEQKNIAVNNPEKFVLDMFPQVDYIVPILTPGYFKSLSQHNIHQSTFTNSNLDEAFTSLVHDLMCKHYVQNNCLNDKFRCLIPDLYTMSITNDDNFLSDPTLNVWLPLSDLDTLVSVMLKN